MSGSPSIRRAGAGDRAVLQALLAEYGASLEVELTFQDFERELADPFAVYESVLLAPNGLGHPAAQSTPRAAS